MNVKDYCSVFFTAWSLQLAGQGVGLKTFGLNKWHWSKLGHVLILVIQAYHQQTGISSENILNFRRYGGAFVKKKIMTAKRMWNASRHVHFYSIMNRKSSGAKAKLMMEKQLEILKQKLILLTWLLKTDGRRRQMERWHREENRFLTLRIWDQAFAIHSRSVVSELKKGTLH